MKGWAEGRRGRGEDRGLRYSRRNDGSLRETEAQGQSWEINLFLEYSGVSDCIMFGKS